MGAVLPDRCLHTTVLAPKRKPEKKDKIKKTICPFGRPRLEKTAYSGTALEDLQAEKAREIRSLSPFQLFTRRQKNALGVEMCRNKVTDQVFR